MTTKRILVLGGGVGGTLTANLLARKLRRRVDAGEVSEEVIRRAAAQIVERVRRAGRHGDGA